MRVTAVERVGDELFKNQGRVKVQHREGELRWYLLDGSEYATVSRRNFRVLHFQRVLGGWLEYDPDDCDWSHPDDCEPG